MLTLFAFEALCALDVLVRAQFVSDDMLASVFGAPRPSNLTKRDGSPPAVYMGGNYNYQATQQVFFISGAPQTVSKGMKNCVTYLDREDYTVRPGVGVHKIHKRKISWNRARKSCMEEGASLAILNSALEENTLLDWMRKENVPRVWIGIHDQFEEGKWVTLSGAPVESIGYEHWVRPNEPDNLNGNQNCALLIEERGMDDVDCTHVHAYLCEINLC